MKKTNNVQQFSVKICNFVCMIFWFLNVFMVGHFQLALSEPEVVCDLCAFCMIFTHVSRAVGNTQSS